VVKHLDILDALGPGGDVGLTPDEIRSLHWLAGTDYTTIDSLVGIFRKLRGVLPRRDE
jgi:hypothetical protein